MEAPLSGIPEVHAGYVTEAVETRSSPEQAGAFMRDMQRVGRALQAVTGAIKLNYEIHGNTIPHLHVHFYPRYRGDPFEGRPIDPSDGPTHLYAPGEHRALADRLRAALRANDVP